MKIKLFSVFDQKALAFMPPFFAVRTEQAMRSFTECANDAQHAFSRSPQDYTLYELGVFDDETALITNLPQPLCLGRAVQLKKGV